MQFKGRKLKGHLCKNKCVSKLPFFGTFTMSRVKKIQFTMSLNDVTEATKEPVQMKVTKKKRLPKRKLVKAKKSKREEEDSDEEEEEEEEDIEDESDIDDDESDITEIVSSSEEEEIEEIPPETEEMIAKAEAERIASSIKGSTVVGGRVLRDRTKIVNPIQNRYGDKERELLYIKDEKKELIREIKIWRETPELLNKAPTLSWPILNVRMSLQTIQEEHERVRIALGLDATDEESESNDEEEDEDEDVELDEEEEEDDEEEDDDEEEEEEEEEEDEEEK